MCVSNLTFDKCCFVQTWQKSNVPSLPWWIYQSKWSANVGKTHPHKEYKCNHHIPKQLTCIQNKAFCLSLRTTQSNLKFQYKMHERRREKKQGGWNIFTIQPSRHCTQHVFFIMKHIVAHGLSEVNNRYFAFLSLFFTSSLHFRHFVPDSAFGTYATVCCSSWSFYPKAVEIICPKWNAYKLIYRS